MFALTERLHELRARFVQSLPSRAALVAQLLMRAQGSTSRASAIAELELQLHALAGTAGTYGLADVADFAHEAEVVCATADSFDDDTLQYLGGVVADLQDAVRRAE